MPNFSSSPPRRAVIAFAALAGLVLLAAPLGPTLADKPATPVTVVNPEVPVTVDNPATSPALTSSVDDPGRVAYQNATTLPCSGNRCEIEITVPSGHRLVIQHVSGTTTVTGTPIFVSVNLGLFDMGFLTQLLSSFFAPFAGQFVSFDQPVLVYMDGGSGSGSPHLGFNITSNGTLGDISFNLTGYLLDCTNIPCAAITH